MFNTFEHRIDFLSNAHKMLTDLQECPAYRERGAWLRAHFRKLG